MLTNFGFGIKNWTCEHFKTHLIPSIPFLFIGVRLTHQGRVTHICVSKIIMIGRRQANIRINAGILLTGPLRTNFTEILSEIHTFSFNKMHLKISSAKRQQSRLGLNVLGPCLHSTALRSVHTIRVQLCFGTELFQPYPSELSRWHQGNHKFASVRCEILRKTTGK